MRKVRRNIMQSYCCAQANLEQPASFTLIFHLNLINTSHRSTFHRYRRVKQHKRIFTSLARCQHELSGKIIVNLKKKIRNAWLNHSRELRMLFSRSALLAKDQKSLFRAGSGKKFFKLFMQHSSINPKISSRCVCWWRDGRK